MHHQARLGYCSIRRHRAQPALGMKISGMENVDAEEQRGGETLRVALRRSSARRTSLRAFRKEAAQ
eukprot:2275173-Heterocapsa_arctica.AAC.1